MTSQILTGTRLKVLLKIYPLETGVVFEEHFGTVARELGEDLGYNSVPL